MAKNHICHGGFDNTRILEGYWEFLRGMLTHCLSGELLDADVMHIGHVLFLSHRAHAVAGILPRESEQSVCGQAQREDPFPRKHQRKMMSLSLNVNDTQNISQNFVFVI